jgi:hypothetical protein
MGTPLKTGESNADTRRDQDRRQHAGAEGAELAVLKYLATAHWDKGARGKEVVAAVVAMVPDWKKFFDGKITDNALVMRADKATVRAGSTARPDLEAGDQGCEGQPEVELPGAKGGIRAKGTQAAAI